NRSIDLTSNEEIVFEDESLDHQVFNFSPTSSDQRNSEERDFLRKNKFSKQNSDLENIKKIRIDENNPNLLEIQKINRNLAQNGPDSLDDLLKLEDSEFQSYFGNQGCEDSGIGTEILLNTSFSENLDSSESKGSNIKEPSKSIIRSKLFKCFKSSLK